MKLIITGASGFIGKHLVERFRAEEVEIIEISNTYKSKNNLTYKVFFDSEVGYHDFDALIHLSGAAHRVFSDEEARVLNTDLTKKIVDKCIEFGIPKVIFLSSISMYAEQRYEVDLTTPFANKLINTASTKLQAENYIKLKSSQGLIQSVIIRSPLVYGEGVKANFASLMKSVGKGLPLPFRAIKNNKRSLVSVYNLVDLIKVCIEHPKAANQVFLASDDNDLSTAEMVALMAKVQGKKNLALPVPVWCFKLAGKLLNKNNVIDRLTGSLQLDISHTKSTLGWQPPYSVEHGFTLAAKKPSNNN